MSPRCVLIVERAPVMARMLVDALADAGWVPETATRLDEALAVLGSRHVNAVVAEVEIPEGDGFELIARARALPGPTPAVILTSFYASPALARRADEAGAFACLGKPFDVEALVAMLDTACAAIPHA